MNSIIKRRKATSYAQIHNNALQQLEDVRAIGLLAHLMSLPVDWEIKKVYLYKKFGRSAVTKAVAELETKRYWVQIKYRDGKTNNFAYYISDIPFKKEEVLGFMKEIIEAGCSIMDISSPFFYLLSSVDFQQLNRNSSSSTVETSQLLKKEKETKKDKQYIDKENIVTSNKFLPIDEFEVVLKEACNSLYANFSLGRWSKEGWNKLVTKFVSETIEERRNLTIPVQYIQAYATEAIRNMARRSDVKHGRETVISKKLTWFYHWLEEDTVTC
ncbi:hypothetical protein [Priestia taiwanensis]|uniref:Uncharacterized protein n=1 Tax=Priestia taiwanensis TaxID=1347902 RepID=A0A917EP97_9BACI|nr:hypothetical protein [Priestia taiwanensis]MBM7363954.1 hypothetical protein [Priestia taiwanensis]GGE70452.1 hypothetical protein GCM10007140_20450 [Priestia taiwanensis]